MKIVIASDHGGYELKEHIKKYLLSQKIEIEDLGTGSADSVDYPIYGIKAAKEVARGSANFGIIICGTGIGISIAANKVKGIRAALCHCVEYAKLSREHNNANMLALGGRFLDKSEALKIVEAFLHTQFAGARHQKRVDIISQFENNGEC